ncbi:Hypothetical predicted protein, partial [Marmota monax]
MESWKMSIFKKQIPHSPPSYGRSLSEPAYANSEIGTSIYQRCGPLKSKRKKNEYAVSNVEKTLGAYRWQKHHDFRLKGGKWERLQNNKGELDELKVLPEMICTNNASSSDNEVFRTSTEKLNFVNTQKLRAPFTRSISEPEPRCTIKCIRPWPTSVGSVESEQQGYFIRGIFSTLSNGFSRMLSLKGESFNEPVRE